MPPTAVSLVVPPREVFDRGVNLFDDGNRFWICLAEIFNDAVNGGQNHQQIRRQQRGDERGQFVVVAEFDFRERHRVVLVDDGYDATIEQCDQRIARVEMTFVMFKVFVREQHLCDDEPVRGKKLVVGRHQSRLADSGASLFFRRDQWAAMRSRARPCPLRPRRT